MFAKKEEVHPGTVLRADGGFTCLDDGEILTVRRDEDGVLSVPCRQGSHGLNGQLENGEYVGLFFVP